MKGLKTVSFVLSAVLAASAVAAFGGCAPKGEKSDLVWGTASEAAFNKEGEYSTTVTVEDASFPADLSANDITIMYEVDDDEAYRDVFEESNGTAQDGGLDDLAETVNAEIKTVTRTDEHTLGITFSDGKADEYRPDSYGITVSRADGKKEKYILAKFEVNYPEYTMTSAISSVSAEENPIRITLTLDEGAFAGDVSPEQISLGGAFRGLTVQSVSAAGKNLTMQLSGKIEKDEYSNAYLNGVIKVDKTAVENCRTDFKVKIPVESEKMCLDPETLELLGDNVTVDVVLGGYRFSGTASADSFKILGEDEEGDTVGFYAVSGFVLSEDGAGNRATLTIGGTDAKSKTEAAETLYGKTLEVAASAIANATEKISSNIELCPASFYPVFDYAEVKDGKFNMTVELYAQNGVFAETLNKNAVTFAKDFESASVTSLTRTNDYTAELVFSVPTDKTSVEDMDLDGTITLAEGSLISAWGEGAPESSYTREYDQDSMGRLFTDMEVGQLKDIVGGFGNTVFGSVVDSLSGIASVGSTIYTGLEVLGVIESEKNKLDKIYSYLQGMNEGIMDMAKDISAIKTDMAEQQIGDFFTNSFGMMQAYSNYCYGVMERARVLMSKEENPPKPLTESSSQDDTVQYLAATVKYINDHNLDKGDYFSNLIQFYTQVCNQVKSKTSNAVDLFDKYMTYYYNFESQAYSDRENFRDVLTTELILANHLIDVYTYYSMSETERAIMSCETCCESFDGLYNQAKSAIDARPVKRRTEKGTGITYKTLCYITNELVVNPWDGFEKGIEPIVEFDSNDVADFNRRMKQPTVGAELASAGIKLYQICKRFLFSLSWDHDCYYVNCEKRVDFHYSGLNDTKLNNYSSFITNKEFMNADWPSEDQYLTLRVED